MIDWNDAPAFGRKKSIKLVLELLHNYYDEKLFIVETGTSRGSFGGGCEADGWATVAFGWYCKKYGGKVVTIDIDQEAIEQCKWITYDYRDVIKYEVGNSVDVLKTIQERINLLYLDSADDPNVILEEVKAAYDKLDTTAFVIIDDTTSGGSSGKGTLAYAFLKEKMWSEVASTAGQVILSRCLKALHDVKYFSDQFAVEDKIKMSIEEYDEKARVWFKVVESFLPDKTLLPCVNGKVTTLDVGCNTGYNVAFLKQKYGESIGIDINPLLISASKANDVDCRMMDCCKLEFDDNTFSLVLAKDILEHSIKPTESINEIYRVLTEGGILVALIPLDGIHGIDEVILHGGFAYGNSSHTWKATLYGVLRKLLEAGFTDIGYTLLGHSSLFGEEREFGDKVIALRCKKKKDIIRMPCKWLLEDSYIGAFITLACNSSCVYCIQKINEGDFTNALVEYERDKLTADEWLGFLNKIQKLENHPIAVIGGEPTLHKGFFDIVNGLIGYNITVTTNLSTKVFNDPALFATKITNKDKFRLNTSFHPNLISVDTFCERVQKLRNCGIFVDQVAMVDYPFSNFKYYYDEFIKHGVVLSPQTFLGKMNGVLFPNKDFDGITNNVVEHGITDENLYAEGFSSIEKKDVICNSGRFLIGPNGNVYRCHYHLYSNRNPIVNIKNVVDSVSTECDYVICNDFGFCNPCDYPHVKFRAAVVGVPYVLHLVTKQDDVTEIYTELCDIINRNPDIGEFCINLVQLLYSSAHIYYDLYHNPTVKNYINSFILDKLYYDNRRAFEMHDFVERICLKLPYGCNIFNILDELSLAKYIDAASCGVAANPDVQVAVSSLLYTKDLVTALRQDIGTCYTAFVAQEDVKVYNVRV